MESEPIVCVICNDRTDEKTTKFTPSTLEKNKCVLKIRKSHSLKYNNVYLLEDVNDTSSYHIKCYKKFLAVMKKYHQCEPSTSLNLPTSSSDVSNASTSSEATVRLLNTFEEIHIIKIENKNYVALKDYVIDVKICEILEETEILQKAASILPKTILNIQKNDLPENITTANLVNGDSFFTICHVIEELETAATIAALNRSDVCPEGIVGNKNLHTAVAFDNFDRYVDTATGKDTLHDTVGIIYQTIMENEDVIEETSQQLQNMPTNIETIDESFGEVGNRQSRKKNELL
ncbi:hypothetical protein PV327_011030, partial [Microctonus hyperodae]